MKLLVIYNYFEEGREISTHINYAFFMKYGYYPDIDYIFVINGRCSIKLIERTNIMIVMRPNTGYDFGAYGHIVRSLPWKYDYYFFINSSVRGPFIAPYCKSRWYEPFIELMKGNIKLVGSTINLNYDRPHVQSYVFLLDFECLMYLMDKIFNVEYNKLIDVIINQEIGMSKAILQNGWNIDSIIPDLQGINWLNKTNDPKFLRIKTQHDMLYSGKLCNGRDLHPYELIFIKINRNLSISEINSLTNYYLSEITY